MMKRILFLLLFLQIGFHSDGQEFIPGQSYFGFSQYIEYVAGNLPVILSAPHGGDKIPSDIPDRSCPDCVIVKDAFTQELIMEIYQALLEKTGCHAHLIINRLHRRKLDANRNMEEATDGNNIAAMSWFDFHDFIESAKKTVTMNFGKGLYIDLHGHSHIKQRLEIGYLLYGSELRQPNSKLNSQEYIDYSSIKNLVNTNINSLNHADLLKGDLSFGSLMSNQKYPSVPSKADPFPLPGDDYFSGGYNTERHGSIKSGAIDGIQIECNNEVRFETAKRLAFADKLASSILDYLDKHYFPEFSKTSCVSTSSELPNSTITFYPNPVLDVLYITADEDSITQVSIFNYFGKKVWSGLALEIPVGKFSAGIYFLAIGHRKGNISFNKFLKL